MIFSTKMSTTAAWNDAATSAVVTSGCALTYAMTAVFNPLKDIELCDAPDIGRGKAIASPLPSLATRSITGPPG